MLNPQVSTNLTIKTRLAEATDLFREAFGADVHEYRWPWSTESRDITAFEKRYGITLLPAYRDFLLMIGRPDQKRQAEASAPVYGMGPGWGLYGLGDPRQFIGDQATGYLREDPFFNEETTEKLWKQKLQATFATTAEQYGMPTALYTGILLIGCYRESREGNSYGINYYSGIILQGPQTGRVVYLSDENYFPALAAENDFLAWYINWLDDIISGKLLLISHLGGCRTAECFRRYDQAVQTAAITDKKRQRVQIAALGFLSTQPGLNAVERRHLREAYSEQKDRLVRLQLLGLLAKFDYEYSKEELLQLRNNDTLRFLALLHIYAPQRLATTWRQDIIKLRNTTQDELLKTYIETVIFRQADFSGRRGNRRGHQR